MTDDPRPPEVREEFTAALEREARAAEAALVRAFRERDDLPPAAAGNKPGDEPVPKEER